MMRLPVRKLVLFLVFGLTVALSACGSSGTVYNFKVRKDDYFISNDESIIVDYKTNEDGKLVQINIDRLLEVQDMIYFNSQIDYEFVLEGFTGDTYTDAGFLCTDHNDLVVPINIEIGNTRFKYDRNECEYQEVDRDNEFKTGSFIRKYDLKNTIDVSRDTIISIVVYDENSIERFVEVQVIPHTMKMLGVYGVGFNLDRDGFDESVSNYYRDIAIYEQLILKHQENESAIGEVQGLSANINILELDLLEEVIPLVDDFSNRYEYEIEAIEELIDEIGVITDEEVTPEDNEEDPEETPSGGFNS